MHTLGIIKKQLPIGSKGWKSIQLGHKTEFPGRSRTVLMRGHSTLHHKQIPTGNSDCPEEVRLAKWIKHLTGNEAALRNVMRGGFDPEEVESGVSSANPNSSPEPSDDPEEGRIATSTVAPSSTVKK